MLKTFCALESTSTHVSALSPELGSLVPAQLCVSDSEERNYNEAVFRCWLSRC